MTKNSLYWRDLKKNELKSLRIIHQKRLKQSKSGFLSKKKLNRLLKIGYKEQRTTDSDFWYNIRTKAINSMSDFAILTHAGTDNQLRQIIEPLKKDEYVNGMPKRIDIDLAFQKIIPQQRQSIHDEDEKWKYRLAVQLTAMGIRYMSHRPEFNGGMFQRMFQEFLETIYSHLDDDDIRTFTM